jgi:hypothetical protein
MILARLVFSSLIIASSQRFFGLHHTLQTHIFSSYMPNRQTPATSKDLEPLKLSKSNQNLKDQHGLQNSRISLLLNVPSETLTGITCYLDPPSLLSVARVSSLLHEHIRNDNTWHRAFVCQFLGIGPESDIHGNVKSLMLRRSESSWRNEFSVRYRLRRYVFALIPPSRASDSF